jgi:hypothetical protein
VASKYNDIDFIDVHDLIEHVKDVTREQVLEMEQEILKTLDFNFTFPTVYMYLQRLIQIKNISQEHKEMAEMIAEVCLFDLNIL